MAKRRDKRFAYLMQKGDHDRQLNDAPSTISLCMATRRVTDLAARLGERSPCEMSAHFVNRFRASNGHSSHRHDSTAPPWLESEGTGGSEVQPACASHPCGWRSWLCMCPRVCDWFGFVYLHFLVDVLLCGAGVMAQRASMGDFQPAHPFLNHQGLPPREVVKVIFAANICRVRRKSCLKSGRRTARTCRAVPLLTMVGFATGARKPILGCLRGCPAD